MRKSRFTALSRRRRGFKSPWGRHFFPIVPQGFEPATAHMRGHSFNGKLESRNVPEKRDFRSASAGGSGGQIPLGTPFYLENMDRDGRTHGLSAPYSHPTWPDIG